MVLKEFMWRLSKTKFSVHYLFLLSIYICILVRVGGGYISVEEFLDIYTPIELEKMLKNSDYIYMCGFEYLKMKDEKTIWISKIFKLYNHSEPVLNTQLHTLLHKRKQIEYKSYWYNLYKKVFLGNSLKLEKQQISPTGKTIYNEIFLNPIRNANNEIVEVACLAHDITENKQFEKQIIEQSAKLKAIFESGDHLIWTVNKKLELTSYNKNYFNLVKNIVPRKKLEENKTISVLDTIQSKEKKIFWIDK